MREHGGNLAAAAATFGGSPESWVDLSTGINPVPYPVSPVPPVAWARLPEATAIRRLSDAACRAYRAAPGVSAVPVAGAQAAIQLVPRLWPGGTARILSPTYNEHAGALTSSGWTVENVAKMEALPGAALAIIVNPNNPDGRRIAPDRLIDLSKQVGALVVDESFADVTPDLSLLPHLSEVPENVLILRSFGKFFGLAGLRLGFALGHAVLLARLAEAAGPWAVSGPAIEIGTRALADTAWQADTRARLATDAARLDALAARAGWVLVGGCDLFRTYETGDSTAAQTRLARHSVWSRRFSYSAGWLRLGLPGQASDWSKLSDALTG